MSPPQLNTANIYYTKPPIKGAGKIQLYLTQKAAVLSNKYRGYIIRRRKPLFFTGGQNDTKLEPFVRNIVI